MKDVKVSEFLHFQKVDTEEDITIGWNRFFPTIFILNRFALELLDAVRNKETIPHNEETETFLKELFKYKFIYDSETDPSRDDFLKMIDETLVELENAGDDFYRLKKPYNMLVIFNDHCNLTCAYCVNQYKRKRPPVEKHTTDVLRREIVMNCLQQFLSRKRENPAETVTISFNGGEILLEWRLIKEILQWLRETYKDLTFEFHMNSNLTLMTGEIAKFLADNNVRLDISIDGYGRAHNRTRKYRDEKGSFADVLRGLAVYREFNKKNPVTAFQGTIDFIDEFNPEEVYGMEKYGFSQARLAPNLLNVSREDALKKAGVMGKFLELNDRHSFQVSELFFAKAKDRINRDKYRFSFNCQGLSCFTDMTIFLNVSTLRVSLVCAYVQDAWLPLENAAYDIYNPKLFHRASRFIKERAEAIKKYCSQCHLVGLCSGGCIYTGLDNENQLNRAACAYQKKLWEIYIQKVYNDSKKS